ncbi:MAG: YdeI/OmpD-associated family protein [Phycisphaerales bacterium]
MKRATAKRPASPKISQRTGKRGDSKAASRIRFSAKLLRPEDAATHNKSGTDGWTFLTLPKQASAKLSSRSQVTVDGTLNGAVFRATLEPDGQGGHWLKVERELRERAGAEPGSSVTLEIAPVAEEPEPEVPADLRKALAAAPNGAREVWADITPVARRDWIQWITSGKKAETRAIRIDKACDMLAKGKRRACCFDRSGMYDNSLSCPVADES